MNIQSPQLEIIDISHGGNEIRNLFEAIQHVNHCQIAYNALKNTFLNNKISRDIVYTMLGDIIWVYSLKSASILAKISFPAPVVASGGQLGIKEKFKFSLCDN